MTIDEMLRLKEAGFTAEEIVSLGAVADTVQPAPPTPAVDLQPVLDRLTAMERAQQQTNIHGTSAPAPTCASPADALARILNPREDVENG